ncbi:MAG: hypothetical protein PHI12_05955 [Dehalococcoidales bacterium]|nr:hypothetical protein [Dehalococcoidales bacterium]
MVKKTKKPEVEAGKRLEWVRRNEGGQSPPQIAKKDGYDVRTVRKHIELAKMEREAKEARAVVLRNTLERHYRGIVNFAQKLNKTVDKGIVVSNDLREDPYWTALKQHQPRISLWNLLARWDSIHNSLKGSRKALESKLQIGLRADSRLKDAPATQLDGAVAGITAALLFNMERRGRGETGLVLYDDFSAIQGEDGMCEVKYGSFHMGKQSGEVAGDLKKVVTEYEDAFTSWDDYHKLSDLLGQMREIKKKIRSELTTIIMRGVVPGHCKYCPL